jgi:hypothetical protein
VFPNRAKDRRQMAAPEPADGTARLRCGHFW